MAMRRNLESQLLHAVLVELGSRPGILAYRVNVMRVGRVLSAPVGHPDVVAVLAGRAYYLEVKSPTGRQTPQQAAFQRAVEAAGAVYVLVRSMSDLPAELLAD